MDLALKGGKDNCINLTTFDDGSIIDWTPNITKTTETIVIQPYIYFPEIFFWQWNSTHYQWCGPMLLIAEYFAKFINAKVSLLPYQSIESYEKKVENGEPLPHFGLVATMVSQYYRFIEKQGLDFVAGRTRHVAFVVPSQILAATRRGKHSLFKQFECLEWEVYFAIFVSIVVISCFMGLYKRSLKAFLSVFWSYSSVILSDYYSMPMNTKIERFLSGGWLLTCSILLAAFSGQLREQVIKIKPIFWVDSWQDLVEWKHLTIQTFYPATIKSYTDNFPEEPMAQDFMNRTDALKNENFTSGIMSFDKDLDYQGIKSGKVALVMDGLQLHILKRNVMSDDFREDIDFHVSKYGDSEQPFFNLINKMSMDDYMVDIFLQKWNKVIALLDESGLYYELQKRATNPKQNGPDFNQKVVVKSHEFEEIFIHQLTGIFILYSIALFLSFILLLFEYFYQ